VPRRQVPRAAPGVDPQSALAAWLRQVADFPRPDIVFQDITPLLADRDAFRTAVDGLAEPFGDSEVDLVVAVESRGFMLGGAVAHQLNAGFIPVRKAGKLPAETLSMPYALEYGEAVLEIHADAVSRGQHVLIVDDLLATGGTAAATIQLVEQLGGVIAGLAFLVELAHLRGAAALGTHRHISLITI
jgi:adenine phosphoribosyltransferase